MKNRIIAIGLAALITAFSGMDIRAMAEQYPLAITAKAKEKTAFIRITGTLYGWGDQAENITKQVDAFLAEGIKDVHVYLNSPGGDVFVAAEIINQIQRFSGSKTGSGGALVASAATLIAIELDSFEMAENGQFMYHKPSAYLSGNEDKIESGLKLLKDMTAQYKSKYALKTGKPEAEIEANWVKGDTWLTAAEAKDQKFITSVQVKEKITPETRALFVACGSPRVPEVDKEKPKNLNSNMENRNQIIAALKLPADATDAQIEAAVKTAMADAGKVGTMTAQAEADKKKQVEEYVDSLIVAKKTTADQRENLINMGTANFDSLKAFGNSLTGLEKPTTTGDNPQDTAIRANWTLADYLEKDPSALEVMAQKEPEKFGKLNDAHYGINL